MRTRAESIPTPPTSAVRNTVGKKNEQTPENPNRPASDAALWEYCDKHYHQLLPLIAEKVHQEKTQQDKLKEVKARLNFEGCSRRSSKIQEVSQHSESRTPNLRGLESPRHRDSEREAVFTRLERKEKGVFNRLGGKGRSVCTRSSDSKPRHQNAQREAKSRYQSSLSRKVEPIPRKRYHEGVSSQRTEAFSESEDSGGGRWKSRSKKQKSSIEEDDLSQPWVREETYPFTPHIRYFDFPKKTRMPSNVKTYDGSEDPEDHLKIFQTAAKVERWAMPTWCHMFDSTLTGFARVWFDDLSLEFVDSYDDLKKAFLANFLQQKKCIKDPVEIYHIKQREWESTEDFVQTFNSESRHVKGSPECMRISGFMHGITSLELIKRLHDNIPKSVDEMMRATTMFLRGGGSGFQSDAEENTSGMEAARNRAKTKFRQKGRL
ncbi:reverse transcriptase domain-containing protein [Tanacetum coccineum]